MPYKHKILLITAAMLAMLCAVVGVTLYYVVEIQRENDEVRLWGRVTDRMHLAIKTGEQLRDTAGALRTAGVEHATKVFEYEDLYLQFVDQALHPEDMDKMTPEDRALMTATAAAIEYKHGFHPARAQAAISAALPRMQEIHDTFWSHKRAAYTYHFEKLKFTTASTVISICVAILFLCLGIGLALSKWTIRSLQQRLTELANWATRVRRGDFTSFPSPPALRDELDTLADCLSQMAQRLITVVSTQKVLEGAEEERRRIAMDLHDEVLGELTHLAREVDRLNTRVQDAKQYRERLANLETGLRETAMKIRRIIDDLHPQSLDILGLEAAICSFLKRKTPETGWPRYSLRFDRRAEEMLTSGQRLNLYRVTCEAINNITQHAYCSEFDVEFKLVDGGLRLTIDDDGIGFDLRDTHKALGHGLNNIRQRALSMHARALWHERSGRGGTRFELFLPLVADAQEATA